MPEDLHHRIVIVGGGTAGITVAARLARKLDRPDIAIVEPSGKHYYQPLWTLVGGGVFPKQASEREEADFIPRGARWIKEAVAEFRPEGNCVLTPNGRKIGYDYLVVAPGIKVEWGKIKGLEEGLGTRGICSNYDFNTVDYTWECLRTFQGGNAVFTQPSTPIKCGGAPQKIMYLADDQLRIRGVRDRSNVIFGTALDAIFAVPRYARTLEKVVARRAIDVRYKHELIELRPDDRVAVFKKMDTGESVEIAYDMIHVTPPMGPPDFVRQSPLADDAGWVDVNRETLRHVRYPNVFALGDASNLPTSKTGAAIRKQAPVLVRNLLAVLRGETPSAVYDGYTSCPLVTGYGKLILAEFDYDKNPRETFPFDQSKERRSMYLLKAYGLPAMYWNGMLRGRV